MGKIKVEYLELYARGDWSSSRPVNYILLRYKNKTYDELTLAAYLLARQSKVTPWSRVP